MISSNTSKKKKNRSGHCNLFALWVERLIKIYPKHARKECQDGDEGQEEDDCPDCNLVQTPMSQHPEGGSKDKDKNEGESVADVHGAEKVSRLTVEVQTAGRTSIIHLWEAPVKVRAENSGRPAPRTELSEDAD